MGLAIVGALMALVLLSGLRVNLTASMPVGLYWTHEAEQVRPGEIVCLSLSHARSPLEARRRFGRSVVLLKRVVAVAGSTVERSADGLRVEGRPVACSRPRATGRDGQPLPVQSFPQVVPEGHVWLSSRHRDGFDSRYLGPVSAQALSCVAVPLWVWGGEGAC